MKGGGGENEQGNETNKNEDEIKSQISKVLKYTLHNITHYYLIRANNLGCIKLEKHHSQ